MKRFAQAGLLGAMALSTTTNVQAQDSAQFYDLGEISLTGALTPLLLNDTGASVSVIEDQSLAGAPVGVIDTLDTLPGVSFSRSGGLGQTAAVRIRGLGNQYVGVRIDGIDVTDPSSTQIAYAFGGLATSTLGRVELIRGSQSALFGSEAVAGLIDISTDRSDTPGVSADVMAEYGSFDTRNLGVGLFARNNDGGLAFNLSRVETGGFSARADDDEDDGFDQTLVNLTGDYAVSDTVTLGFAALYGDADTAYDLSATDNSGTTTAEQSGARVYAEVDAFGMDHVFSVSGYRIDRAFPGGFTEDFSGRRTGLSYLGSAALGDIGTLNFGLDRTRETFEIDGDGGDNTTNSALAELLTAPADGLDLAVSLRYDDDEDFGGHLSGRLAAAYQLTPDTTLRAVAGTGFRAPSLYERSGPYGDPALDPEESRSFELGIEQRIGDDGVVSATAFHIEIDDLIDFDGASDICGSGFGCYNQVPGTTRTKGLELAGRYALTDAMVLKGGYTYTDAANDGTRLVRVPRHDLVLGLESAVTERLSARLDAQYVADLLPSPFAPADNKVGDYTLVNAGVSYDLTDTATAYLRVENLFDEDYETVGGFNTSDRAIYAGLRARF